MALTLQQQFDLGNEQTFVNLVALAMAGHADNVMTEDQSGMTPEEAAARTSLAALVIHNAQDVARARRWYLAAQASGLTWQNGDTAAEFAASIPDATYSGFISAQWSILAGYRSQ